MPPRIRHFDIDPESEAFRLHGYRSDEQRAYLHEQLAKGRTRPVADYIHTLRYDEYDYASIGRVFVDLYQYLEDEYPDRDERTALLRGIVSPSAI